MLHFRLGIVCLTFTAGLALADVNTTPVAQATKAAPAPQAAVAVLIKAQGQPKLDSIETTHKSIASISVKGFTSAAGVPGSLQTICLNTDGKVVALVAPMKPFGTPVKGAAAELHLYDADGKFIKSWKVDFHVQSINCGPDGTIYAAGDGKLARFDKDGKEVAAAAGLPHIATLLKDTEGLRKKAEIQLKQEQETYGQSISEAKKQFAEKVKELEAKKPDERTKTEARQLDQFKKLIEQYDKMEADYKGRTVDQVLEAMTGRVRVINGISVSAKDIFVACGDTAGYGYAIWRLSPDLKDSKQVLNGIGGCCGQMDIQCLGADILVAENTKHQFARYDREGKKIGAYGKRGQDADPACFGGCCNPMNVRASGVGDVYTAESEGIIKRFSPSGEFLETAGVVKFGGGCKNVAVAVSPDASKLYFCDQPGLKFHILEKKTK